MSDFNETKAKNNNLAFSSIIHGQKMLTRTFKFFKTRLKCQKSAETHQIYI